MKPVPCVMPYTLHPLKARTVQNPAMPMLILLYALASFRAAATAFCVPS